MGKPLSYLNPYFVELAEGDREITEKSLQILFFKYVNPNLTDQEYF